MSHDLNAAQREAVNTLSGPLLVLAGAGTGKTRVVIYRIAKLIKSGVPAQRILAVTFTNKAANEMRQRTTALLGRRRGQQRPEISTFHSLCVRVLRRHITVLGYPKRFAIYDRADQESVARATLREIKVPGETLRPSDFLYFISRWKMASVRPRKATSLAGTDKEHLAAVAYRRYQNNLKSKGAVDFDDLLLLTEELFEKYPDARRAEADRFDHLLIDEYQDTNGSQYRIIKRLAIGHRNLCVVGDDDQSIYGWRGAEITHILRFERDWPRATVVRLEENYRSTAAILERANQLILFNKNRHDKVLRAARHGGEPPRILQFKDETAEAEGIVQDLKKRLAQRGTVPRDFAILFRTNEQPRAFEMVLRKENLPYVLVGGMSFYDRKEVRDLLAYLKVLANPHDEPSLLRIINTPPRGIGQATVKRLLDLAVSNGKSLWSTLGSPAARAEAGDKAARSIGQFRATIESFRSRVGHDSLSRLVSELIQKTGYTSELSRIYTDPTEREARMASVEEIVNAVANYEKQAQKPTLSGYLEEAALGDRDDTTEKDSQLARNAIALMTLHSAKGLEFPQVYLVGLEEGILPHHRSVAADGDAIDEERRLCYVGVTRARDRLTLSLALTRKKWGKARDSQPSRFLYEFTGQAELLKAKKASAQTRLKATTRRKSRSPARR